MLVKKFFRVISRVMWFCFRRCRRFEDRLCLHHQGRWVDVGLVDPVLYLYLSKLRCRGRVQLSGWWCSPGKHFAYSQLYGEDDRRKQAYSAHHQPESWKRPRERSLDRYKYRTGSPTRPRTDTDIKELLSLRKKQYWRAIWVPDILYGIVRSRTGQVRDS